MKPGFEEGMRDVGVLQAKLAVSQQKNGNPERSGQGGGKKRMLSQSALSCADGCG